MSVYDMHVCCNLCLLLQCLRRFFKNRQKVLGTKWTLSK